MKAGILGPMLVVDDSGTVFPVAAARQRALLAALLVRPNRIVPVDELAELVWVGKPPAEAQRTVRSHIVRLRHAVRPEVAARITTQHPGYLVRVAEEELDTLSFEAMCRKARVAVQEHSIVTKRGLKESLPFLTWFNDLPGRGTAGQAPGGPLAPGISTR